MLALHSLRLWERFELITSNREKINLKGNPCNWFNILLNSDCECMFNIVD